MDSFARGLKNAAKLIEDGTLDSLVKVSFCFFWSSFRLEKIIFFLLQRTWDKLPRDDIALTHQ